VKKYTERESVSKVSAGSKFDPCFGSAIDAIEALRSGLISSRELTEYIFRRIKKHNAKINAFVTLNEEKAIARAMEADEAMATGKIWGPLHGLPILIKDAFYTAGLRTTCGDKELENYIPQEDAIAVGRLLKAGAIIIGKTNTPIGQNDIQTYNLVAGTTNNPWDVNRTSGGSTGGGAAALAAGLGFLELGADLGGSIRTPSNFCGVFGHKSSLNIVPVQGMIPPMPGLIPSSVDLTAGFDLAVIGPMARCARDLKLELEIISGPSPEKATAYSWALPPARKINLKEYRIGFVTNDPFCPVIPEISIMLSNTIEALRKHGIQLQEGWPDEVNPDKIYDIYLRLLGATVSRIIPEEGIKIMKMLFDMPYGYYYKTFVEGITSSHKNWSLWSITRLLIRATWQEYFKKFDAFIMPANFAPAFAHDHDPNVFGRIIATSNGQRFYGEVYKWISIATLTGCPATAVPIGRTKDNLPVGIQIMGPFLEDATTIDLATKIEEIIGGFVPPPEYGD
jgi:amidase